MQMKGISAFLPKGLRFPYYLIQLSEVKMEVKNGSKLATLASPTYRFMGVKCCHEN